MKSYSRAHLSDEALLRDLATATARERGATAEVLALIAEVDERKLYLPAGYSSMFAYCVGELRLSEDAACKRITVARAARRFPAIFAVVAEGQLHLSALVLLAPHLTEGTVEGLLEAAAHKTKSEVDRLLAERFPQSDMLAWVQPIPSAEHAASADSSAPGRIDVPASGTARDHRPKLEPLSAQSFAIQFTISRSAHEKLRYAQDLLGGGTGDIAHVFERALDALIPSLEKQKFAATARPRRQPASPSTDPRHIPAHVRRAVWERDGGRCSFVGDGGRRCEARRGLQFDHVLEVARGGEATVDGIRLLCRAHNQFAAERTFGSEFMRHKRIAAKEFREAAQAARAARAAARGRKAASQTQSIGDDKDVVPYLRALKFSAAEARQAAERCADLPPEATIEERVRTALKSIRIRGTRFVPAPVVVASAPLPATAG
jgi:hypothetical protein